MSLNIVFLVTCSKFLKATEGTTVVEMTASIKMQNVLLNSFKLRHLVQNRQKVKKPKYV